MNNVKLEDKLRLIKEIKSERYVGTLQAWSAIKRMEAIEKNPERIAQVINYKIRNVLDNPNPVRLATGSMILGIIYVFDKIVMEIDNDYLDNLFDLDSDDISLMSYDLIGGYDSLVRKPNLNRIIEEFTPPFISANKMPMDDNEFGNHLIVSLLCNYDLGILKMDQIENIALSENWPSILHDNNFNIYNNYKELIYTEELNLGDRIKKVLRDQIDHRLEIRREILTDYLKLHNFSTYDEAIDYTKKILESPNLNISSDPHSYKIRKNWGYILHTIVSDRNFVNRYLKN